MSYHNGPRIITNGLVLYLDAGNSKSYPGSGSIWNDLSGNGNNGTLTNGPTFSSGNKGSIVFDGSNDFVQCSGSLVVTSATFICWIRRSGTQNSSAGILFSRGTNVTGMNFRLTSQLGYHWNDASNTYNWSSNLILPDLAWSMCAVSVMSSAATAYLYQNSGLTTAVNNVSHASTTLDDIKVAQDDTGSRFFTGNIAQALLYNRALSPSEVRENYNATKGRFGL